MPRCSTRERFAEADCDFGHQEHTVFEMNTTLWAFLREMLHTGTSRTLQEGRGLEGSGCAITVGQVTFTQYLASLPRGGGERQMRLLAQIA